MRLGLAGQFRLIISIAVMVAIVGVWGYVELTDAREASHNVRLLDTRFEEATTVVVALRNKPPHLARALEWIKEHYTYASYLIVDDAYALIAQSEPPPPSEHLDKVAHYDWDIALALPLVDAEGERFYVSVIQESPAVQPSWIDRFEFILPAFLSLVFLGATIVLARRVLSPIRHISNVANTIAAGTLHQRTGVSRGDEIGDLARAFDSMADRNAELLVAQKNLLAQVGHELRTPLARIQVALDIAKEKESSSDERPFSEIEIDLEEMARLISDILAVSRLETADVQGTLEGSLRIEELDFALLTKEVMGRFSATHPDRILSGGVATSCELIGDRVLLARVLWNLLENAHKHSPLDEPVMLSATVEEEQVTWVVEDAGCGVEPDLLVRVFEPFFQGRTNQAATMGGYGLGLSLCKRVVDAHGGSILLENRREGGLRARVSLPLVAAKEGE